MEGVGNGQPSYPALACAWGKIRPLPKAGGGVTWPETGLWWHHPLLSPGGPGDNVGKGEPPFPFPFPSTKGKWS